MPDFSTSQLEPTRLNEALPLVQMSLRGVDGPRWLSHCAAMARAGGGVLATAAPDGALFGIASWRPDDDLQLGAMLRVELMVAIELSASNPVRISLCDALGKLCERAGAALSLPFRRDDLSSAYPASWKRTGFRHQSLFVCRPGLQERVGPPAGAHLRLVESPAPSE